jgi:8-oxo-dGTP diphosphatase
MPVSISELRFTVCFLTFGEQLLMLKRKKPPNKGLWNGVGGHIEPGESPLASCLREVHEETGYQLTGLRFCGLLTWRGYEIADGGLYLFTGQVSNPAFVPTNEGILAWKPRSWVFSSPETVSNIHYFGPQILNGAPACTYHFDYSGGKIQKYEITPLPPEIDVTQESRSFK